MKKVFLLILCLLFILPSLVGCHAKNETAAFEVPNELDMTKSYELSFWAKNDTNKIQTKIYQTAIEEFQKLYPNIKVNLKLYNDYGRIYNDVITNIATDTTPNICITYPDHIATYLTGEDVVVPLDSLMNNEKYGLGGSEVKFDSPKAEEITKKFLDECMIGGITYAMPFMRSTEACYVNKTYVEKLGYTLPETLTWDFVWEVSAKAAEKDADGIFPVNGQKVMIPFIYKSTDNMMIQMLKQQDAGYSTVSGEVLIFNDTTRQILDDVALATEKNSFSTFKISSYPGNFFNAGQCIFAIDSTAGATWIGSDAPLSDIAEENVVDFETVVMRIPQYDIERPQMISQGPSMCLFNKSDPDQVLASWLFMQYLLTNDVQTAYSQTEGYVPVTDKARQCEEYKSYLDAEGSDRDEHYYVKIQAAKLLLDNTEYTFVTPVFNGSASLRNAAGQMIENVVKSVKRKETLDDAYYDKLYSDITSLYRLDQIQIDDSIKPELGRMPPTAVALLATIGAVWVIIVSYVVITKIKSMKK